MKQECNMNDVADQLRREAAQSAPAFSSLLHARIMQRIERGDVVSDIPAITRPRPYRLAWAGLAAAAASVALLMMLHPWSTPGKNLRASGPDHTPTTQPGGTLPQFALGIDSVTIPASRELEDARFAYLDRDAKNFASYMMRQMDVLPDKR